MLPAIRGGELLLCEPVDPEQLRIGESLLCRLDDRIVAHRLSAIQSDAVGQPRLVLCGDALETPDPAVTPERVLAKGVAVERRGRVVRLDGQLGPRLAAARRRLWAARSWLRRRYVLRLRHR